MARDAPCPVRGRAVEGTSLLPELLLAHHKHRKTGSLWSSIDELI